MAGTNLPQTINTNPVQTLPNGVICTLENDTNCYDFIFASAGILARCTWTASNDTTVITTNLVGIERSQDLTTGSWQLMFTNSFCALDTVYTFTDTNAPAGNGFYRVLYLNTPDMVDTNDVD